MTLPLSDLGITVFERGWLSSNLVLLESDADAALVDSGYATHAEQTIALLTSALGIKPLQRLCNTHLHSDHCGGNAAIKATFPAVRIAIPPAQADAVAQWDEVALTYEPTGQQCPRFMYDEIMRPGQQLRLGHHLWQVHAAPGHDPAAVILFEPTHRILISADALWENGFGIVFPELEGKTAFKEVGQTLDVIDKLNPAWVIPGHGRVFSDVDAALHRARTRLQHFESQPHKHRRHALKVLIKFKLLEWQQTTEAQLAEWFLQSSYFRLIAGTDHTGDLRMVLQQLLNELETVGALARRSGEIHNA